MSAHTPGPAREVTITTYGARENGARALGLAPGDGLNVLITPSSADDNEAAEHLARRIMERAEVDVASLAIISAKDNEIAALKSQMRSIEKRLAQERAVYEAAVTHRRRFFGSVLMKPVADGDWSGAVWLLDPEKRERGYGLRFSSVAEVRELHPELWVVSASNDGVLLDACAAITKAGAGK